MNRSIKLGLAAMILSSLFACNNNKTIRDGNEIPNSRQYNDNMQGGIIDSDSIASDTGDMQYRDTVSSDPTSPPPPTPEPQRAE
ncbi:hypothetical protein FAZ15_15735 [Sphingobacterium olei]|uniref:Lipoprotein n=1 Tax=Sphingobacterium olei TaxID=2571155 RepID=A0A4U0NL83_9SPHI|nr:hypothetical protein [Sphingobacterium olei]TJZ54913.1 hypothetical protein FAZ15_15735 [Sphingobacterium olei]